MATFEIVESEGQKMVKATLAGDTVRAESGALHYYQGNISVQSKAPSASGLISGMLTGETVFKPTYTGTGAVFFGPPNFGEYAILQLNDESWVLDQGAYVCSDADVKVGAHRNKATAALMGGEGLFQTAVSGTGAVVLQAPGKIERVQLSGDRLAVDGRFAVARSATVNFRVERASRSVLGSMTSGEGLLNIYQGQGIVLLSPVPNLYQSLITRSSIMAMPVRSRTPTSALKGKLIGCGCTALIFIASAIGMAGIALLDQLRIF
jgi:uncharacterized protein (AIM24 family)